jgi:serine protease inhibitor
MYRRLTFVVVAACLAVGGCSDKVCDPKDNPPRQVTDTEQRLIDSFNKFGINLLKEISREGERGNVFISPLSVSMALGMTYNGAAGTTESAMRETLEFDDLTLEEINEAYGSLIELLSGLDPNVQFQLANSIWYRLGYTFKQDFIDRNQTYFNAVVRGLNFGDPGASVTINNWVGDNTGGRIEEIVPEVIDPLTVMFLINAIYFKGAWTYEFDPGDTEDDTFRLSNGTAVSCRMMNQIDEFRYFQGNGFEAIDLPYGDGDFSMVVILPSESKNNVDTIIDALDQETWRAWLASFEEAEGHLQLPKFTVTYEEVLNDVLTGMGMGVAFEPATADFTGMYEGWERLYISSVKHKTFVNVDEEGTEAAAVTSVEVGATGISGFWMRVDRPFLFAIRDSHSQTILFIGKIVQPVL